MSCASHCWSVHVRPGRDRRQHLVVRQAVLDDLAAGHEREPAVDAEQRAADDEQEDPEHERDHDEEVLGRGNLDQPVQQPGIAVVPGSSPDDGLVTLTPLAAADCSWADGGGRPIGPAPIAVDRARRSRRSVYQITTAKITSTPSGLRRHPDPDARRGEPEREDREQPDPRERRTDDRERDRRDREVVEPHDRRQE